MNNFDKMNDLSSENMCGFRPGEECSICKGRCCRERGCTLEPADLFKAMSKAGFLSGFDESQKKGNFIELAAGQGDLLSDAIKEYIVSGKSSFAIDMTYTAEGSFYYLRMKTRCYTFIGLEGFGICSALKENGCSLGFEDRPKGGRMLKSSPDFNCRQEYGAEQLLQDWKPYQRVLSEIWEEHAARIEEDGTLDRCEREYMST